MIPLSKILDQALKKMPCAKKIKGQLIMDAWPIVVGEMIAAKTQTLSFENGLLFVWVRDSVWAQHLSLQKKQIINKLNRHTKTRVLTDIRFQVGGEQATGKQESIPEEKMSNWREEQVSRESLLKIEQSILQENLPIDLAERMKTFFIAQEQRIKWYLDHGYPPCTKCGMPVVTAGREDLCLCCKADENGVK